MRLSFALVLLAPALAHAQPTAEQKTESAKWVAALQAPDGGFYPAPPNAKSDAKPAPSLRATNAGVRALKYLGADVPNKDRHAAFVLKCYDKTTGGFAEPGGKPDVALTSVGVMAAMELGIPKDKFARAMDYLKANAKTFEEVRIGAGAVEAWGVKDCPFDVEPWLEIATGHVRQFKDLALVDGKAREIASRAAMLLRLGWQPPLDPVCTDILAGQRPDGGWSKKGEKESDIETTYRVVRALRLFGEKPKDVKKLRAFLAARRNADGGYATKPGDTSSASGVYYCAIISKWLDELEK
jgi:prenyltransferase beta subunit